MGYLGTFEYNAPDLGSGLAFFPAYLISRDNHGGTSHAATSKESTSIGHISTGMQII